MWQYIKSQYRPIRGWHIELLMYYPGDGSPPSHYLGEIYRYHGINKINRHRTADYYETQLEVERAIIALIDDRDQYL